MDTKTIRNAYIKYRKVQKKEFDQTVELLRQAHDLELLGIQSLGDFINALNRIDNGKLDSLYSASRCLSVLHQEARQSWDDLASIPGVKGISQFMTQMETLSRLLDMPRWAVESLLQGNNYEVGNFKYRIIGNELQKEKLLDKED